MSVHTITRKPISKRQRFEILKRDGFACTYCGRKSPDVQLEIDHVKPVAGGGCNCMSNLVTACYDCNRGKGVTVLGSTDDDTFSQRETDALQLDREVRDHFSEPTMDFEFLILASLCADITPEDIRGYLASGDSKEKFLRRLNIHVYAYILQSEGQR